MLKMISRYYHTLRHLKFIQIRYQIWYRIRNRFFPVKYPNDLKAPGFQKLKLAPFPRQYTHYLGLGQFQFLNLEHDFDGDIDWNYSGHGKLWAYHLNYFDYLHQEKMDWETGKSLMDDFLKRPESRTEGLEPYPISLRTINWIKYLAVHDTYPVKIVDTLYAQYKMLTKKIEYHLMANHLLENAFSLLFGAVFFRDARLITLTRKILINELDEQILEDGAHFELSPMYHVILLQRALDGYNLLINNKHDLEEVEQKLREVIQKMVDWLHNIMFSNGDIPMVNDSTGGQALEAKTVLNYASELGFSAKEIALSDSGYRKFVSGDFELFADVGSVGPSYQPGHAHSDTLSFVLYHKGKPVIIDRGISTYEKNKRRDDERSTASHNTVMINGQEQTDVWGGFRVGRRAKPLILEESQTQLGASHTGYNNLDINHTRVFQIDVSEIKISDKLDGEKKDSIAFMHLHPDIKLEEMESGRFRLNSLILEFKNFNLIKTEEYEFCSGFNRTSKANKIRIEFNGVLKTKISNENIVTDFLF
jgi:hypothetical protein